MPPFMIRLVKVMVWVAVPLVIIVAPTPFTEDLVSTDRESPAKVTVAGLVAGVRNRNPLVE